MKYPVPFLEESGSSGLFDVVPLTVHLPVHPRSQIEQLLQQRHTLHFSLCLQNSFLKQLSQPFAHFDDAPFRNRLQVEHRIALLFFVASEQSQAAGEKCYLKLKMVHLKSDTLAVQKML